MVYIRGISYLYDTADYRDVTLDCLTNEPMFKNVYNMVRLAVKNLINYIRIPIEFTSCDLLGTYSTT